MIRVSISLADASVTETETLTAGRVGLECAFTFTSDWDGLQKVAVFEGAETLEVALGSATIAVIPPECMATAGYNLRVGAYGLSEAKAVVIPTVWAKAGKIKDSAAPDEESFAPATPELVAQIMQASQDALTIAQNVSAQAANGDFDGADGYSPTISTTAITGGTQVNVTDVNGTSSFNVMDGEDGTNGQDGVGVPSGGTTGQYLKKASGTDYDTAWATLPGDEVFWATYGTTTSAQLEAAYQAGQRILCNYSDRTYAYAYRTSATKHTLSVIYGNSCFALICNSDSWSATTYALAQSANVPAKATNAPSDLAASAAIGSSSKYAAENHVHKMPSASDVGAIPAPVSANDDDVLTYDDGAWVAKPGGGGGSISPYTSNPAALGTASPGSSDNYARGDHVHAKPSASDIGAIAAPVSPSAGDVLTYSGGAWRAAAPASVPSAATNTPADLGTAAVGSSSKYAKEDHVHNKPSYTASEVGAIASPSSPTSGDFLVYSGSAWVAMSLSTWQGGSY